MNILYIAHRIPYPPDKGDKIRSFHEVRFLSRKHTIHLISLVDDKKDLRHVQTLEKYCASVEVVYRTRAVAKFLALTALFTAKPLSVASFYSKELERKISRRLRSAKIEMIFVFCSAMAQYVQHVSHIPKVIDFVDVDSEKWRLYRGYHRFPVSWIYRLEADRLARYETQVARAFKHSIVVSENEATVLKQQLNCQSLSIIPNGVDLDYFRPNGNSLFDSNQQVIVFTGVMDYFPNVDAVRYFCKEIFPLILNASPDVQFYIVGRNPTRVVRELNCQPRVIVTGAVPDVRPFLARGSVAIAPFRIARGVQNKVLEAMAMSLPVVGTSLAFQGIQATPADGVRIADDPKAIAQEVAKLLKDRDLYLQCSRQVRKYVERQHRWQDHGTRLESLLKDVC